MTMTAPPREPIGWICDCDLDTLCSGKSSAICPSPREMYVNGHPRKWFPLYLDAAPAPSAEPPAQAATERMGTHWETCATDGGPRHYDCALRLIEQQAREIAELRADKDAYHYERAEAERDALRECVRAADVYMYGDRTVAQWDAYQAARAKVQA